MSGFESPNYTMVPNDLFEHWLPLLSSSELRVILAIIRETIGYHRADATMGTRALHMATGLCKTSILQATRGLERKGLILRYQPHYGATRWTINVPSLRKTSRYQTGEVWAYVDTTKQ